MHAPSVGMGRALVFKQSLSAYDNSNTWQDLEAGKEDIIFGFHKVLNEWWRV